MQDLPIGFDASGADAWAFQDVLAHGMSVGAPPDEFNTKGQNWGLPPFVPARLRSAGYEPFVQTIRACLRHAGGLRIDHVMGLFRLFWIPEGRAPRDGAYVESNGGELLSIVALESQRARAVIVGEDLGTVEESTREQLAAHHLLSYRLLWFEKTRPVQYPVNALTAITTVKSATNPSVVGGGVEFTATARAGNESGAWRVESPGFVPGLQVNSLWARGRDNVFAYGSRQLPTGVSESWLYRWNGNMWREAFHLPNTVAISVFGTNPWDVFVSAYYQPSGPAVVYRSTDDGVTWEAQTLPPELGSRWLFNFAGTPNDVQASAGGDMFIRFQGTRWETISAGGVSDDVGAATTMLSPTDGHFVNCWGHGSYDGTKWTYNRSNDLCDVGWIWGARDPTNGVLTLLAVGNAGWSNGIRLWRLEGSSFGTKMDFAFGDPVGGDFLGGIFCGRGSFGTALGVWGSAPDDVWLIGRLGRSATDCTGTGRVYHFDGQEWVNITQQLSALLGETLPVTTAVVGTGPHDVWVALEDGRLLRYAANYTPTGTFVFRDNGAIIGRADAIEGAGRLTTSFSTAGTHNITAEYSGDANFAPSEGLLNQIVNRAAPIVSWPQPSDVVYGTRLGTAQFNAIANVPGVFQYTPNTGTLLPVGTQTLTALFTPADSANYATATVSTRITVRRDTTLNCSVHIQNVGWRDCVDGVGGTWGQSLRMEAFRATAPGRRICYSAHVQNIGWGPTVCDGAVAGTTGRSLRLEALRVWLDVGHIAYMSHLQNIGWTGPVWDGAQIGTTGQSRRMEAVALRITDSDTLELPARGGSATGDFGADISWSGFNAKCRPEPGVFSACKYYVGTLWSSNPFFRYVPPTGISYGQKFALWDHYKSQLFVPCRPERPVESCKNAMSYSDANLSVSVLRSTTYTGVWLWVYPDHVDVQIYVESRPGQGGGHAWVRIAASGILSVP
jgi:hypothetical protein